MTCELTAADTVVGIGAHEFSQYLDIKAMVSKIHFQLSDDPNYHGIAIWSYDYLENYNW